MIKFGYFFYFFMLKQLYISIRSNLVNCLILVHMKLVIKTRIKEESLSLTRVFRYVFYIIWARIESIILTIALLSGHQ